MDKLHQVKAGRAGGKSRSLAKRASSAANLQKARLKRWPGREQSAQLVHEAQLIGGPRAGKCVEESLANLERADKAAPGSEDEQVELMLASINMQAASWNKPMAEQTGLAAKGRAQLAKEQSRKV